MKRKSFPKTLFVKFEDGGSGPDFLGCYENAYRAAEKGEKIQVATYKLLEVVDVELKAYVDNLRRAKS